MEYERFSVSKLEVGRRQLLAAIRMHFDREDPLAIHTVSSAANEVLVTLAERQGIRALVQGSERIRPEHREEFLRILRAPANFLKHADRDPDSALEFSPNSTHMQMIESMDLLERISGASPPECLLFTTWIWLRYPDVLNERVFVAIPNLGNHLQKLDWRDFQSFRDALVQVKQG